MARLPYNPRSAQRALRTPRPLKLSRRTEIAMMIERAAKVATIGLFVLALLYATMGASFFLAPVATAFIVGLTLGPVVGWLERRGVASYAASALLILSTAAVFYGLYLALAAPAQEWLSRVPEIWDKFAGHLRTLQGPLETLSEVSEEVEKVTDPGNKQQQVAVVKPDGGMVTRIISSVPAAMAQVLVFVATLYFFLANRTRLRAGLLSFCTSRRMRLQMARIMRDIEYFLSRYVMAISFVNIGLGVATGLAMAALGLPAPALWGALAAVLNFIPYLGPTVVIIVLAGVGMVTFERLFDGLLPALVFFFINLVESQIITPTFIGRTLTLNSFLVFLFLAFWMWMWGPIGAFIAVPILIICVVAVVHVVPRQDNPAGRATFGKPAARAQALAEAHEKEEKKQASDAA